MKVYHFTSGARTALERAGVTQTEIAKAAGISRFHINRRLQGQGNLMPVTANKIARAFADVMQITHSEALTLLFEELDDLREQKRKDRPVTT